MMTPLPWWVFLVVVLLATAVCPKAHPNNDACVRLCRAQTRSSEIIGVCEYQRFVLQSDGGQSPIQRLFGLCLTPCSAPGSPEHFESSEDCHSFREFFIRLKDCSCEFFEDERANGIVLWRDSTWLERLFNDYEKYELNGFDREDRSLIMLKSVLETRAAAQKAFGGPKGSGTLDDRGSLDEAMRDGREDANWTFLSDVDGSGDVVEVAKSSNDQAATTPEPESSEEYVDWEMWCMAQCDNGQGGSACNCDIIP